MAILVMAMIINFVINPAFSLMPLLVTEHFKGGALQLGWLGSGWGIGMVLGGLLLSVWGGFRHRVYTSLAGLVLGGIGIMGVGLATESGFRLALVAIFGRLYEPPDQWTILCHLAGEGCTRDARACVHAGW